MLMHSSIILLIAAQQVLMPLQHYEVHSCEPER